MTVFLCLFEFSPIGPESSITPLCFVMTASAIKEIIEDRKRHRADKEMNSRPTRILRDVGGVIDFQVPPAVLRTFATAVVLRSLPSGGMCASARSFACTRFGACGG